MDDFLARLGIGEVNCGATTGGSNGRLKMVGRELVSISPIDGKPIAKVIQADGDDYQIVIGKAQAAFGKWRMTPAPVRGQIVRQIGCLLREHQEALGKLVTLEMGKIAAEGRGEVQEMIDIADFAVGQSRMLYGLTMHSERPQHRMYEQWHPLGPVGVITAYNFPVAVWAWNALIAAICGDVVIWKPSSLTPLTAIAVQNIIAPVIDEHGLDGLFNLVIGPGSDIGEALINDRRIPLISMTGSTAMGIHIAEAVGRRLGRSILELGGNNAIIVAEDADLDMAVRATLFGAIGTSGQRCTSTRRIIVQRGVKQPFVERLVAAYRQVRIGNPLEEGTLMGPVVDEATIESMEKAIKIAESSGGRLLCGGRRITVPGCEGGFYVAPAIMEVRSEYPIVREETFAPLLYIIEYRHIDEAMEKHNDVPQGLSSAIFTKSMHYQEQFLSSGGSDCGIANVNIGTSGAEIGGAFGGEKETGGGREAGSDAWKQDMRRQTSTINWGHDLPLAQGIRFDAG
jgi:aldehyde dehydrogenase (NAD+)